MAYTAFITRLKNVRPHPNADRLQMAECFGNTIVVDLSYTNNQLGIYFPADGQVSLEFAEANNLLRKKDENGNNIGGYMDADKRNVTAIKLRGEKSEGLFLPLTSLQTFGDISTLAEGDRITNFNGHEICCKYIPRRNTRSGSSSKGNRTRKKIVPVAPLFAEHADTEQLAYNLGAFKPGDQIEITLKMHGTSQRTGYLPVFKGYATPYPWARKVLERVDTNKKMGWFTKKLYDAAMKTANAFYDWGYVSGTRRVVLENFDGGYYGSNEFREAHSKFFEGKLWKGETVYYEVVGFTHTGAPIMATADNKKLNDKEFIKQYGKTTTFSYGCDATPTGFDEDGKVIKLPPESDIYVYRMTMTNEDGDVVEYTPEFMRYRCEQMGVKTVPVMWKGFIEDKNALTTGVDMIVYDDIGEYVRNLAEQYYDGPDPIGKTHIREGVVVRIVNRPKFTAFKSKNWFFKALEGIVKVEATAPDIEEEQEVVE